MQQRMKLKVIYYKLFYNTYFQSLLARSVTLSVIVILKAYTQASLDASVVQGVS